MKLITFVALSLLSVSSFADYGSISCTGTDQHIKLEMEEISDISVKTAFLSLNKKRTIISRIKISQTDYGILGISAQIGTGPGKHNYIFSNLGSSKCFSVYGSNQKGQAYVEVINALGVIAKINCKCEQY